MANVKISELPVATSLSNGDSFPVVQGGVTKQAARSVLFASPTFTGTTTADLLTATGDVTFDGGAFVFNESGADKDARFEGDTDANLLFLDASTDRAGIGTSSPAAKLHITNTSATSGSLSLASPPAGSGGSYIIMGNADSGGAAGPSVILASNRTLQFGVGTSFTSNTGGTFSEQMRLDASGNLGLGVTPSAWGAAERALDVGSTVALARGGSAELRLMQNSFVNASNQYAYKLSAAASNYEQTAGAHRWYTAPSGTAGNAISFTQAMTLDASGNLLVGATSAELGAGFGNLQIQGSSGAIVQAQTGAGTVKCAISADSSSGYSGTRTNHPLLFITNNTERARITDGGDFIHQVNGAAPTLSTNSTMSFELTSNTSLKIVVRGTDGTTRSVSLTLA